MDMDFDFAVPFFTIGAFVFLMLAAVFMYKGIKRRRINKMFRALEKCSAREVIDILVKIGILGYSQEAGDKKTLIFRSLEINCGTKHLATAIESWLHIGVMAFKSRDQVNAIVEKLDYHDSIRAVADYIFRNWSYWKVNRFIKAMKRHKKVHDDLRIKIDIIREDHPGPLVGTIAAMWEDVIFFCSDLKNWCVQLKEKRRQKIIARGLEACGCEPEQEEQKAL